MIKLKIGLVDQDYKELDLKYYDRVSEYADVIMVDNEIILRLISDIEFHFKTDDIPKICGYFITWNGKSDRTIYDISTPIIYSKNDTLTLKNIHVKINI